MDSQRLFVARSNTTSEQGEIGGIGFLADETVDRAGS